MLWILISITGIFTLIFTRNLFNWIFSMDNYFVHKKRLKQLEFEKKENKELSEIIDSISTPANKYLVDLFKNNDKEEIAKKLSFSGWDKYFTTNNYFAFKITLRIAAVAFLILTYFADGLFVGFVWGAVLTFGLDFLLNNAVDKKKDEIYALFPDFLRITQGFLSSGMPFIVSLERTLPYLNSEWQNLINDFITTSKTSGTHKALDELKNSTDMFELKEFTALVKLILEQGGDMREGFEAQADSIKEMQQFLLEKKINKRKTFGILVQAPLLLAIFATFGLPLVRDMTKIGIM
jgi:Flp pilus assembly protein TadB